MTTMPPEAPSLHRFERWARASFVGVSVAAVPFITLVITADTLLRYFAGAPLEWSQDVAGLALFLLFAFCFPYSWTGKFHVRMDMIYVRFPRVVRNAVDTLAVICAFAFGGFLAFRGFVSMLSTYRMQSTMPAAVFLPLWPFMLAGAVAFTGFCLVMVVNVAGAGSKRGRRD